MAFEPKDHLIQLKGKDYLQVAWRLAWLRDIHPEWQLETELLKLDDEKGFALFKATVSDPKAGGIIAQGHGSETRRDFGDYIEKAETKAVGRALAMAGLGTQFCFADFDEGERIVDSPVQARTTPQNADKPKTGSNTRKAAKTQQTAADAPKTAEMPEGYHSGLYCDVCGGEIQAIQGKDGKWFSPEYVETIGQRRFGKRMCAKCQNDAKKKQEATA